MWLPGMIMKSCKIKYRGRCFYTKGALLVLVWTLLLSIVTCSLPSTMGKTLSILSLHLSTWWIGVPLFVVTIAAILSGIFADIKLGKYKVIKLGFLLLFTSTVINCITNLFLMFVPSLKNHTAFVLSSLSTVALLAVTGIITSIVNILQLGLDQMPDASTSSITSFIAWFAFSIVCGPWINDVLNHIQENCLDLPITFNFILCWNFFLAFCTSSILISDFLTAQRWLIKEPKSSQSLRIIYQVLKFAAKHKAPVNRSAFTYWEEDIPSRIDLGKSKYGGPFSTEQVEDVKTVLRLLLISLSLWFVVFAVKLDPPLNRIPTNIINSCSNSILMKFTYGTNWWILLATLAHEFCMYPLARDLLPSILKKIGIATFISVITSLLCLFLTIVNNYLLETHQATLDWTIAILYSLLSGVSVQVLVTSIIEFIYAQSPYNIRGVFIAYISLNFCTSVMVGKAVEALWHSPFIALSAKTFVGLIAFVLHCVAARWYKRRVRDDVYASHRVIEEVYDRYLSYNK